MTAKTNERRAAKAHGLKKCHFIKLLDKICNILKCHLIASPKIEQIFSAMLYPYQDLVKLARNKI